jgi:hypothetical protein
MKKYHIIYNWPIEEILRLTDSPIAETYSSGLAPSDLTTFTTITEKIRGLGADLGQARAARIHFSNWNELGKLLEQFETQFSSLPDLSPRKFRLFVLLAEKLINSGTVLDEAEIDETLFEIRELPTPVPLAWFSRENRTSFSDSVAAFSLSDMAAVETELPASNISPTFLFHCLAALHLLAQDPHGSVAVVKRTAQPTENEAIDAFVRLVILTTGKPIHSTKRYPNPPTVISADDIRAGVAFNQWTDVLSVLSEYNSRDELLMKYLTIYHVIENFMFKFPIVELERKHSGQMFSIRNFKQLYTKINKNEGDALQKLFSALFPLDASPGVTFDQHITDRWSSLSVIHTGTDIDQSLVKLGLSFKFSQFGGGGSAARFAELVYAVRNAVAHNKETEFHLTYASMDVVITTLMESFLIPSLEELSFALISSVNPQLWYSNKHLLLYK